jgi:hypothetical protein
MAIKVNFHNGSSHIFGKSQIIDSKAHYSRAEAIMSKLSKVAFVFILALGALTSFHSYAGGDDELSRIIYEKLEKYRSENQNGLLSFELYPEDEKGPARIESTWGNVREVVKFYHGVAHRDLKTLFELRPDAAHPNVDDIKKVRGKLDSPNQVKVTNTLKPFRIKITFLDEVYEEQIEDTNS